MSFGDITLGQYFPGKSPIHSLDPRSKILLLFLSMIILVVLLDPVVYVGTVLALLLAVYASGLPFQAVFRNLRPFLWLFLLTFILNLSHDGGKVLFTIPYLQFNVSDEGLLRATFYTIRIGLMIGFASLFTLTTAPIDIADGLSRLFAPLQAVRVPVSEFATMIMLGLRFIPTLLDEAMRIRQAQLARGANFDGNLMSRLRSLAPLTIPLFVSVFRKADDIALAMEARCYRLGRERTNYNRLEFRTIDYAVLSIASVLIVIAFLA